VFGILGFPLSSSWCWIYNFPGVFSRYKDWFPTAKDD
jgi:hypothetical protein